MPNPIGARKNSAFKAVSTAPSFNKTPVGSSTPPLPYPTFQDLGNSVGVVPTVKFNGDPVYVLNKTTQPSGKGDAIGVAKGVKSGTVTGEVKPTKASSTVNVGKRPTVRQGDACTMNGGNNPGIFCITTAPSAAPPKSAAATSAPAPTPNTTPEKSMWEEAVDEAKTLAKDYKENMSETLHEAAASAAEKGDTLIVTGTGAAVVGGIGVLTGIGAGPGAVVLTVGSATASVGTGVSTVAGVAETVATGLDVVAEVAITGQLPDMSAVAMGYFERIAARRIERLTKFIPGMKGKSPARKPEVRPTKIEPKPEVKPPKIEPKPEAKPAKVDAKTDKVDTKKPKDEKHDSVTPKPAGDGTTIEQRRRRRGRCELVKFSEGCASGTPHHVVPDHCFKKPKPSETYYPGGVLHKDGLCICVTGAKKGTAIDGTLISRGNRPRTEHFSRLAQHGQIHMLMDEAEKQLGLAGNPKYTTTLGELEDAGARTVAQVTGCDEADLKKQLRDYHGSRQPALVENTKWRADPSGKTLGGKNLDATKLGTSTPLGGDGDE